MADTQVAKREASPMTTLRDLLKKSESQIKMALPRHMSADRMLRVTLTAVQRTPELLRCDPLSVVGCVVQASQLGLEPDGILGNAYLIPFNNRKTGRLECQLIAGYRGLIELARRSGHLVSIAAHVVYERDKFTFSYGIEDKLEHVPYMGGDDRGDVVCVYAVARLRDGGYAFDVMSKADVEKIRAGSKAGNSGPWQTHWSEMARKTVIRRLVKYLSLSPEIQKAVALDEMADAGVAQSLDIEVESSEAVAGATAHRQAEMRERYAKTNGEGQQTPEPAGTSSAPSQSEDAQPEQPSEAEQRNPRAPGVLEKARDLMNTVKGAPTAYAQVCGDKTMDELDAAELRNLIARLESLKAEKQPETRKTRPAADALFGE